MERIFLNNRPLQQDNVYPHVEIKNTELLTGFSPRRGLEHCILSNDKLVNVVSKNYSLLPNENFFTEVESRLINDDIDFVKRSINRDDRSFAVDYILQDENFVIKVKNGVDKIRPMMRFTNSYDGSARTSGNFGFFREVCSNGLHVGHSEIGFKLKHKGDMQNLVLPEIKKLVALWMDNQFYTLSRKFEVLAETPVQDLKSFVKFVADESKLFVYESSEKNPAPSKNARFILDTIEKESKLLQVEPNKWLAYNAFNELLHNGLKKTFDNQKAIDNRLFELIAAN
jgi:hypothetical protein